MFFLANPRRAGRIIWGKEADMGSAGIVNSTAVYTKLCFPKTDGCQMAVTGLWRLPRRPGKQREP
jgi:hypothetical protein